MYYYIGRHLEDSPSATILSVPRGGVFFVSLLANGCFGLCFQKYETPSTSGTVCLFLAQTEVYVMVFVMMRFSLFTDAKLENKSRLKTR